MPGPPKRPAKKKPPTKPAAVPAGLPSSEHSDINDIVRSILPDAGPDPDTAPLSELAQNPWNPRYGYNNPQVVALSESLTLHGQIDRVPVMPTDLFVTYFPDHADKVVGSRWVLLDGNRRYAAAELAELPELRIDVAHTLTESALEVRESVLLRNIHHEALPPLLEARELEALVAVLGSQVKVAQRLSRTQGWVSQRLSLLRLAEPIQRDLAHGRVTIEHARAVAKVADPEQQVAALHQLQAAAKEATEAAAGARTKQPAATPDADEGTGAAGGKQRPDQTAADASPRAPRIQVAGSTVAELAAALVDKLDTAQLRELVDLLDNPATITS